MDPPEPEPPFLSTIDHVKKDFVVLLFVFEGGVVILYFKIISVLKSILFLPSNSLYVYIGYRIENQLFTYVLRTC